jgi:hypothetical protein
MGEPPRGFFIASCEGNVVTNRGGAVRHSRLAHVLAAPIVVAAGLVAIFTLFSVTAASAATLTFVAPGSGNMENLDHHAVYTWLIPGLTAGGSNALVRANEEVRSAVLHFENIRNWNSETNRLFMHLLDTARTTGAVVASDTGSLTINGNVTHSPVTTTVYRSIDDPNPSNTNLAIRDDLGRNTGVGSIYTAPGQLLVADTTANTPIGNNLELGAAGHDYGGGVRVDQGWAQGALGDATHSFSTTAEDYNFTFGSGALTSLNAYILNGGDFAIGLDPDCHYFNDGIWLTLTTGLRPNQTAVPEPGTMFLVASGLACAAIRRRRSTRSA